MKLHPLTRTLLCLMLLLVAHSAKSQTVAKKSMDSNFRSPPDYARPGVYWYFMDGNLSKEGMTKDLESMKKVGIGNLVFLEVNVGVPRGKVDFLSEEWKQLFKHAVAESERLGIEITLGVGPGWTGSGGPWVKGEQSMQHLVSSAVNVTGNSKQRINLPKPAPRSPYFGEGGFTSEVRKEWESFYEDVVVLAFPTPSGTTKIEDIDEKSLVYRAPYTSAQGVKPFLPTTASYDEPSAANIVKQGEIIDLSSKLGADGVVAWDVPAGNWTIMRFGSRNNGAVTRPAPNPGVGLESNKFDTIGISAHLDKFIGELFRTIDFKGNNKKVQGGLKMLHMDSWEMGAQNWTQQFREEFTKRRGYDPQPFYPVYAGFIVNSREISERFLWDLRKTSQDLILENHAGYIKNYAGRYGLGLSIEPYDMNPTADMELGAIADRPMCEFWSTGFGFNSTFSAVEGSSLAHLKGVSIVPAEAFTAQGDGWAQYPGRMKNQTDWAFAAGINRLVYHTFQHQSLDDKLLPGMTMGPYGVHWDRSQTWWSMVDGYHLYVTRSQYMLQQGRTVADILYLCPEVSPHVFRAPQSAMETPEPSLPDKKGYSFDACPPSLFYQVLVKNKQLIFPSGATYNLLVLPVFETMTPELLRKIKALLNDGATIVGLPPRKTPSLVNYPACDQELQQLVMEIWGGFDAPAELTTRAIGKGKMIWGTDISLKVDNLYPEYKLTEGILASMNISKDFETTSPIRYTHRTSADYDIFFVSNRSNEPLDASCLFRITGKSPELWNAMTGEMKPLPDYTEIGEQTKIPLVFAPYESYFVVFRKDGHKQARGTNFTEKKRILTLGAPWKVSFDPKWGGPANVTFDKLGDWAKNEDLRIKYYSGTATYEKTFDLPKTSSKHIYLRLGKVGNMARVWLNGKNMGVIWTNPWQLEITKHIKSKNNSLKIEVANLWINRLIGDEFLPDDGPQNGQWPEWLVQGRERTSGRYTFTSHRHYSKESPLSESGLLEPVSIWEE